MKNEIHSHHTFMFPFIFEVKDKNEIVAGWEYKEYVNNYNEATYFHKFFKESMFTKKEGSSSDFYTNDAYRDSEIIVSKSQEYKLHLKSVNLRIFATGVGILSFHIENSEYSDIKSILAINEFARRIYPEYLDARGECSLVPDYVKIKGITEDFKSFSIDAKREKLQLSKIITNFLPVEKITPAIDDRMFVISFYKNNHFSNDLKTDYKKSDRWYEYVFIDADGKTVQNTQMQEDLITKATYARWQNYGTMYGISRYSFVALSENSPFIEITVEVHMRTMYFQMFSLLLMVRATILKFSDEASEIAKNIDSDKTEKKVENLYKNYIKFVNNFYFREVTSRDQGLEIYEKALEILNIERNIKDLDAEIEELHTYVNMKVEKKTAQKLNILTWIGGFLLPPSLVTGFLGMNTLTKWKINEEAGLSLILVIASAFVIPIILSVRAFLKKENHE